MPRSAASAREDGSLVPGSSRPPRTASRNAASRLVRTREPVRSRCRSSPAALPRAADPPPLLALPADGLSTAPAVDDPPKVAHVSAMQLDHTLGLFRT